MSVLRFCLGLMSLGAALFLGGEAYWCQVRRGIFRACGASGNTAELFGLNLSYPLAITMLVVLFLISALGAVYAFFFSTESHN